MINIKRSLTPFPLAILAMVVCLPALAGDVQRSWVDRFNGPAGYHDYGNDIAVAADGSVYVTGFAFEAVEENLFYPRYVTRKLDASGEEQWVRYFHGEFGYSASAAYEIEIDPVSGDIIVAGQIDNGDDWATLRYAPDGTLVWSIVYVADSSFVSQPHDLFVDGSGSAYLTGYVGSFGNPNHSPIVKYDNDGNQVWRTRYTGPEFIEAGGAAVVADESGNVYWTGWVDSNSHSAEIGVLKLDVNGTPLWERTEGSFGRFTGDIGQDIVLDSEGNVIVLGIIGLNSIDDTDIRVLKYSPDGDVIWKRTFGRLDEGEWAYTLAIDSEDNIVVAGSTDRAGNDDALVIKYASDGKLLWDHTIAGEGNDNDRANDVKVDVSGDIYAAGVIGPFTGVGFAFTAKLLPDGTELWLDMYGGPSGDGARANALALGSAGLTYMIGESYGETGTLDQTTIAYEDVGSGAIANLEDVAVTFGTLLSGTIESLRSSDDVDLVIASAYGFLSSEPNIVAIEVGALSVVDEPVRIELAVEARLNNPNGMVNMRLRNFDAGGFQSVHSYVLGTTEMRETASVTPAAQYVRSADGRIELSMKTVVVATFSTSGFRQEVDHIEINVE
ncbi:MAG: hypothetical protein ACR2GY_12580 [Phycisphaerales bacterium]